MNETEQLQQRIKEVTNWHTVKPPKIVTDTSDCMRIERGNVLRIGGQDYVIKGNLHETRFGIEDQPKYWVFSAVDLETGREMILKTVFHEEFHAHIGVFKIKCFRSPEKEAEVLDLVRGDKRFMNGHTEYDDAGNNVRVIDFIKGPSIFQYIHNINKSHEQYFHEDLPSILHKLVDSMKGIRFLHDVGTCHGDIRNDHIIIERGTGNYRWIDFDLNQHVLDFDVWSMGNIISYVVGQGIRSFHVVLKGTDFSEKVKSSLVADDGSAFYEYRIINLKKLFPYIPNRLNHILMHFSRKPQGAYDTMEQLLDDYREMLAVDFPTPVDGPGDVSVGGNQ